MELLSKSGEERVIPLPPSTDPPPSMANAALEPGHGMNHLPPHLITPEMSLTTSRSWDGAGCRDAWDPSQHSTQADNGNLGARTFPIGKTHIGVLCSPALFPLILYPLVENKAPL